MRSATERWMRRSVIRDFILRCLSERRSFDMVFLLLHAELSVREYLIDVYLFVCLFCHSMHVTLPLFVCLWVCLFAYLFVCLLCWSTLCCLWHQFFVEMFFFGNKLGKSKPFWLISFSTLHIRAPWIGSSEQKMPQIKTGYLYSYVKFNYWTWVRSLAMLVNHSLPN